jgi:hypothetical protein
MSPDWKPEEYERNAELLKKAVESLRKGGPQQPEKRTRNVSPRNKRKPRKKEKG